MLLIIKLYYCSFVTKATIIILKIYTIWRLFKEVIDIASYHCIHSFMSINLSNYNKWTLRKNVFLNLKLLKYNYKI